MTRKELHDLVWSEPAYKIAERYGVSGVALAKRCRKAGIPLPPRGYWARLQFGKKAKRAPLAAAPPGISETVVIVQGLGPRAKVEPEPALALDPEIEAAIEDEASPRRAISVPEFVTRLHPEAKKLVDAAKLARDWAHRNDPASPLERRRARILHAFFRAIEQRGGSVTALSYDRGFDVELLGSEFAMSCGEPEKRVRVPMTREQLKSRSSYETRTWVTQTQRAGYLRLRTTRGVAHPQDFRDTEERPLEEQLNDVMAWLFRNAITVAERERRDEAARVAAAEAAERAHEAVMERYRVQEERRNEHERVAALLKDVEDWRSAERLRAYVAAAHCRADADDEWKSWALAVANRMDPLNRYPAK